MKNHERYTTAAEAEDDFLDFCHKQQAKSKGKGCYKCPISGSACTHSCRVLWLYSETTIGDEQNEDSSNTNRKLA